MSIHTLQYYDKIGLLKPTKYTESGYRLYDDTALKRLQDFIAHNFYSCSNEILDSLGQMYADGGEFTANIDRVSGNGTAAFAAEAVRIYCS